MTSSNFQELRDFICESDKGKVFDSLLAVELGLDHYEAFWQAHMDMSDGLSFEDKVVSFITDIYGYIGFEGDDIEQLVSTVADE